jgi:hypothetical protein
MVIIAMDISLFHKITANKSKIFIVLFFICHFGLSGIHPNFRERFRTSRNDRLKQYFDKTSCLRDTYIKVYINLRLRSYDHGDMISLQPGRLFNLIFACQPPGYLIENLHSQLRPYNLPSPEIHDNLGFVPFFYEPVDISDLQFQIMFIYLGPDLDLLQPNRFFLCMLFIKLIFIFSEIQYLAYGRVRIRRYFDQIKIFFSRPLYRLSHRHHPCLLTFTVY